MAGEILAYILSCSRSGAITCFSLWSPVVVSFLIGSGSITVDKSSLIEMQLGVVSITAKPHKMSPWMGSGAAFSQGVTGKFFSSKEYEEMNAE